MTVLLHTLPADHPLRTAPLGKLDAQCRCVPTMLPDQKPGAWRDVKTWYIGRCTYNQLGPSWTETSEFRCEDMPCPS